MNKTARRQLLRVASRHPRHRVALRESLRLDGSLDLNRLIRIASYNPELRSVLLPIIKEAANQPGRRKGKAEVSFLVWTMDAKDKNGGALIQKRPGVRAARKSIPAQWFMPVKDLKKKLEKVTDRKKRRALNVANKAGLAAVRKLYKAWFEKNWVTPWVKGEDEGYDYEPSAEDEDEFRLKAVNRVLGGIASLKPSHKPTSRDLKRVKRLKSWLETGSQRRQEEADQAEWEAEQREGADDLKKKRREDYRKTDRYKERAKDTQWGDATEEPEQAVSGAKEVINRLVDGISKLREEISFIEDAKSLARQVNYASDIFENFQNGIGKSFTEEVLPSAKIAAKELAKDAPDLDISLDDLMTFDLRTSRWLLRAMDKVSIKPFYSPVGDDLPSIDDLYGLHAHLNVKMSKLERSDGGKAARASLLRLRNDIYSLVPGRKLRDSIGEGDFRLNRGQFDILRVEKAVDLTLQWIDDAVKQSELNGKKLEQAAEKAAEQAAEKAMKKKRKPARPQKPPSTAALTKVIREGLAEGIGVEGRGWKLEFTVLRKDGMMLKGPGVPLKDAKEAFVGGNLVRVIAESKREGRKSIEIELPKERGMRMIIVDGGRRYVPEVEHVKGKAKMKQLSGLVSENMRKLSEMVAGGHALSEAKTEIGYLLHKLNKGFLAPGSLPNLEMPRELFRDLSEDETMKIRHMVFMLMRDMEDAHAGASVEKVKNDIQAGFDEAVSRLKYKDDLKELESELNWIASEELEGMIESHTFYGISLPERDRKGFSRDEASEVRDFIYTLMSTVDESLLPLSVDEVLSQLEKATESMTPDQIISFVDPIYSANYDSIDNILAPSLSGRSISNTSDLRSLKDWAAGKGNDADAAIEAAKGESTEGGPSQYETGESSESGIFSQEEIFEMIEVGDEVMIDSEKFVATSINGLETEIELVGQDGGIETLSYDPQWMDQVESTSTMGEFDSLSYSRLEDVRGSGRTLSDEELDARDNREIGRDLEFKAKTIAYRDWKKSEKKAAVAEGVRLLKDVDEFNKELAKTYAPYHPDPDYMSISGMKGFLDTMRGHLKEVAPFTKDLLGGDFLALDLPEGIEGFMQANHGDVVSGAEDGVSELISAASKMKRSLTKVVKDVDALLAQTRNEKDASSAMEKIRGFKNGMADSMIEGLRSSVEDKFFPGLVDSLLDEIVGDFTSENMHEQLNSLAGLTNHEKNLARKAAALFGQMEDEGDLRVGGDEFVDQASDELTRYVDEMSKSNDPMSLDDLVFELKGRIQSFNDSPLIGLWKHIQKDVELFYNGVSALDSYIGSLATVILGFDPILDGYDRNKLASKLKGVAANFLKITELARNIADKSGLNDSGYFGEIKSDGFDFDIVGPGESEAEIRVLMKGDYIDVDSYKAG